MWREREREIERETGRERERERKRKRERDYKKKVITKSNIFHQNIFITAQFCNSQYLY